jgi:dual specificity tyrosine-phosphorylation-regulated kinase 2/3/4
MTPQSASWSSRNDTPASAALLPQPSGQSQMGDGRKSSSASSIGTANARRHAAKAEPTPAPPPTKKLSQSSIPFFRRTSSSSISTTGTSKPTVSQDQRDSAPPTRIPASSLTSRKSVLGIGIPSLLKGSSSKRNLAVARENAVEEAQRQQVDLPSSERKSSLGWSGRRRGKVSDQCPCILWARANCYPDNLYRRFQTPWIRLR